MSEWLVLLFTYLAGCILGAVFFGGLWWTVRIGAASDHPQLWFLGSLVTRTVLVCAAFFLVGPHGWKPIVLCFIGLMSARAIITHLVRRSPGQTLGKECELASKS